MERPNYKKTSEEKPVTSTKKDHKEDEDYDYYGEYGDYYEETAPASDKSHPKYKTVMCRNTIELGSCNFPGCSFAHSREELRKPKQTAQNKQQSKYFDQNAPLQYYW